MVKIKAGGQTKTLTDTPKILELGFHHSDNRTISMVINDDSLSYLTLEEALDLKIELTRAIENAIAFIPK